jgi:hypothetical protein
MMMDEDGPDAGVTRTAAAPLAPAPSCDETAMSDGQQHQQQQRSGASDGDDTSASQAYESVRAFALQPGHSTVDFNDALARFVDIPSAMLARVFEGLCREGVLAQVCFQGRLLARVDNSARHGRLPLAGLSHTLTHPLPPTGWPQA